MFIARRELNNLREENRKLKLQLAEAQEAEREYNRRSAIIDKAALPKCKSIACSLQQRGNPSPL